VVFGKANTSPIDLSSIAVGSGGFVINGQCAGDYSGGDYMDSYRQETWRVRVSDWTWELLVPYDGGPRPPRRADAPAIGQAWWGTPAIAG
jgi:hypothetical protein